MTNMKSVLVFLAGAVPLTNGLSLNPQSQPKQQKVSSSMTSSSSELISANQVQSRRDAFRSAMTTASLTATVLGGGSGVAFFPPRAAVAAGTGPSPDDLNRLKVGYEQIRYLLDNFDKETTVCRENGGECKRNADPIRKALGLRTTTDPLFQIEKVFAKVKNMDLDPDKLDAFFDATEEWSSAVNMSNSMAFISQFGEYNPGGGQDEVLKYLNESKKQLMMAEDALRIIMDSLDVDKKN